MSVLVNQAPSSATIVDESKYECPRSSRVVALSLAIATILYLSGWTRFSQEYRPPGARTGTYHHDATEHVNIWRQWLSLLTYRSITAYLNNMAMRSVDNLCKTLDFLICQLDAKISQFDPRSAGVDMVIYHSQAVLDLFKSREPNSAIKFSDMYVSFGGENSGIQAGVYDRSNGPLTFPL